MTGNIRPVAIGIFRKGDSILVFEGYDPSKDQTFCRPLGGGINFGEHSRETLIREIREELRAEISQIRYLATLENIFVYNQQPGHEVVAVYEVTFVDSAFYEREELIGYEDDGTAFKAVWRPLNLFQQGAIPLYPDGLLELLT